TVLPLSSEAPMSFHLQSNRARTVVALIATRGREELLLGRATPSIARQTVPPDRIMIVVDHDKSELPDQNLKCLAQRAEAQWGGIPVSVLRNRRTAKTAAGAWTSGIDQL